MRFSRLLFLWEPALQLSRSVLYQCDEYKCKFAYVENKGILTFNLPGGKRRLLITVAVSGYCVMVRTNTRVF